MDKFNFPELNENNYFMWNMVIKTALTLKRLDTVTSEVKAEGLSDKDTIEWNQKKKKK